MPAAEEKGPAVQGKNHTVVGAKEANTLAFLLKAYIRERNRKEWTYHFISLFQYTRQEKVSAAIRLFLAIQSPRYLISKQERTILKEGTLASQLNAYILENGKNLSRELHTSLTIKSIDQLVDYLNQRNPIQGLVSVLKQYKEQRLKDGREMYYFAIFPQFLKQDKIDAVDHLVTTLETKTDQLSEYDFLALSQGSLGDTINAFIEDHHIELAQSLGVEQINNLGDIFRARLNIQEPKTSSNMYIFNFNFS